MDLVKISDLTNQLGISSRSLRYYEQVGLIQSVRPAFEKYRYYNEENIERLKQIMVLRKMQIPIKDILQIYESQDMSVVVEAFVRRIQTIEEEETALSELKQIVNSFLQTMLQNGIKKISALPLLYEEMSRQLEMIEDRQEISYSKLDAVSEKLEKPLNVHIVSLPSMRVLTSQHKHSGGSDIEGFYEWLEQNNIPAAFPGDHTQFESQDEHMQPVVLHKIQADFENNSPYSDGWFDGGLFAVTSFYLDEDMQSIYRRLIHDFDSNPYYEIDYRHDGRLRCEPLVESVLSPDSQREKAELYLPLENRLPDASLYKPITRLESMRAKEIEEANPALWESDVPMDGFQPILDPYYHVNENGEAEYIAFVEKRVLSTGVKVRLPFRVDLEFRVDEASGRFGYGADEGSIRFYHGSNLYGINMENKADPRLSKHALCFQQPIFGDYFEFPDLGRIEPDEYNRLTWIIGEKYFAVILNGEVRYCGTDFPYMNMDLRRQPLYPVILGSGGQGTRYFRSVRISQLKQLPKTKWKEGAFTMITRQSNNVLPNLHRMITKHYGENYWFNGCARYLMECLGETDYDYNFFAGLTGDCLAQVYPYDHFRGDGVTDYKMGDATGKEFIQGIFEACGYSSTYVPNREILANRQMYLQTLMAYIDKGIPVIRYQVGWGTIVGYEEYGKILLCLSDDRETPERVAFEDLFKLWDGLPEDIAESFGLGWIFVGEKQREVPLEQIYRDAIRELPSLLTTKTKEYCFGAEAFRTWAQEIESGKFDGLKPEEFDEWVQYSVYICNLATNASCCYGFLKKAMELCPEFGFLEEVMEQYQLMSRMWNNDDGKDLEAIGGGFNITLEALQNPEKRAKIVCKLRDFAVCTDKVIEILNMNLK